MNFCSEQALRLRPPICQCEANSSARANCRPARMQVHHLQSITRSLDMCLQHSPVLPGPDELPERDVALDLRIGAKMRNLTGKRKWRVLQPGGQSHSERRRKGENRLDFLEALGFDCEMQNAQRRTGKDNLRVREVELGIAERKLSGARPVNELQTTRKRWAAGNRENLQGRRDGEIRRPARETNASFSTATPVPRRSGEPVQHLADSHSHHIKTGVPAVRLSQDRCSGNLAAKRV